MRTNLKVGFLSVLALGLVACGTSGDEADTAIYVPPQEDAAVAPDTTPVVDVAAPDPYVYVVIYDREAKACATNGPGVDIDAVALVPAGTVAIAGWGLTGSSTFIPNPVADACTNAECNGGNCKYAYNGVTFTEAVLRPRTEGPADAVVNASTDDVGYFSLNGGTLQIQIGNTLGGGVAQEIKKGDYIYVYEVDQTYVTAAYPTCTCAPEHYTVKVMSASGLLVKDLTPATLSADNVTCEALTALSTEGCGTTTFVVP
jgi:hypothetical protein